MIEKLPPHLQEFMYSEDTGAALLYLGKKYNLPDEKVHLLSKLAGDVVLGIVPITSLVQEINSKILSDPQMAMALAQELYSDLLAPTLSPQTTPAAPATQPRSVPPPTTPAPTADRYREPGAQMAPQAMAPQIVNLRKPQPPVAPVPTLPAVETKKEAPKASSIPAPGRPSFYFAPLKKPVTPVAPPAPQPIKPIFKLPLIEASPHEILTAPVPKLPSVETKKQEPIVPMGQIPAQQKETLAPGRQFILRPPGMPPADRPHDILDLRKDKGEF